jgi:hypothetical protein
MNILNILLAFCFCLPIKSYSQSGRWDDGKSNWTEFMKVIYNNDTLKLSEMINNGFDINFSFSENGLLSPLEIAIRVGNEFAVEKLLEKTQ